MDATAILNMLADPKTLKAHLEQMAEQEKRLAEHIGKYTKLVEYDDYLKAAQDRIDKANLEAAHILAEAEAAVEKSKAELYKKEQQLALQADKNAKDLGEIVQRTRANEQLSKELAGREKLVADYKKSLDTREEILSEKEKEIDMRLAKLRSVMQ